MNRSFYGGPQGQSFIFKVVFPNYSALQGDINKGFNSEIGVGEFVLISYGDPNKNPGVFQANLDIDLQIEIEENRGNHNNEVYCKAYDENGFTYQFITNISAVSPAASVELTAIDSLTWPKAQVQSNNGNYKFSFELPKSARFYMTKQSDFQSPPVENSDSKTVAFNDNKIKKAIIGDYIIGETNGHIYLVQKKEESGEHICAYQGQILPPTYELPTIKGSVSISNDNSAAVTVVGQEGSDLTFSFSIPKGTTIYTTDPSGVQLYEGDLLLCDGTMKVYKKDTGWIDQGTVFTNQVRPDDVFSIFSTQSLNSTSQEEIEQVLASAGDDTVVQLVFSNGSWLFVKDKQGQWINTGAVTGTNTPLTIKNNYNKDYINSNEGSVITYSASTITKEIEKLREEIYKLLEFEEIPSSQANTGQ